MKKMLFITPELPYPANSGGKLKTLKLLEHFREHYQVGLACALKGDDSSHATAFIHRHGWLDHMIMYALQVERNAGNWIRSIIQGVPLNVLRSSSDELREDIAGIIDNYDVVFIDHYEAAQYVPASFAGQRIYHAHNAYYRLWESYARHGRNPLYRLAAIVESKRVKNCEVRVCNASDIAFAAPNDIDSLVSAGADAHKMQLTYHLGDDKQLALPAMQFANTAERLVYTGSLEWEPNVQGLLWFIEQVWPTLTSARPELQLHIVGKGTDARLQRLLRHQANIVMLGFVDDLEDVFPCSRVSIAPLLFGAGMKVKVLNAMARGIPVVTTPVGAEGIAAQHGRHLLVSDDADHMASDILRLLTDPQLWQTLAEASRELVEERYTWRAMLRMMLVAMDPSANLGMVKTKLLHGVNTMRQRVYQAAL